MAKTAYHYTSGNALKSIVENKKIWFSDIRCMNDYGEQQIFTQSIIKESTIEPFKDIIKPDEYKAYEEMVMKTVEEMSNKMRCFILSCSLNNDSLPMWDYYSKGDSHGGYNIGFNIKSIVKYIYDNIICKIDDSAILFGKVSYCNNDSVVQECLNNFFKYFVGNLDKLNGGEEIKKILMKDSFSAINNSVLDEYKISNEHQENFENQWLEFIKEYKNVDITKNKIFTSFYKDGKTYKDYININNFIKSGDFSYEKEFRIAILIPSTKIDEINKIFADKKPYKTRYQNGMCIPYLEIEIPEKSFASVKIAPTNFTMKPEENLREFLKSNNVDALVDKSKITVRF